MKLNKLPKWDISSKWIEKCPDCGNAYEILTQPDNDPEYITNIYLKCIGDKGCCQEYIHFALPVN